MASPRALQRGSGKSFSQVRVWVLFLDFMAVLQHGEASSPGKRWDFLIQFIIRGLEEERYLSGGTTSAAECGRMTSGLET